MVLDRAGGGEEGGMVLDRAGGGEEGGMVLDRAVGGGQMQNCCNMWVRDERAPV